MNRVVSIIIPTASGEGFCTGCQHADQPCRHVAKDYAPFDLPAPKRPQVEGNGRDGEPPRPRDPRDPREHCW